MKIKKKHLEVLFNTLKGTEGALTLSEARQRDSFLKPLMEKTNEFILDRNKIYDTFSDSKENLDNNQVTWHFPPEKLEEKNTEEKLLLEEEVELESPANLKELIEKTTYSPKIGEAEIIDELIKSL